MTPRESYISARFNDFLERLSPPKALQGNERALQEDADTMLRTILRYAPAEDYSEWVVAVLTRVQEGMKTRTWPSPGEIAAACRAIAPPSRASDADAEEAILQRMTAWYHRFGDEMPGHGREDRTRELIRRGVLAGFREARFRGFDLSFSDRERAFEEPMTQAEQRHHDRVMDGLRALKAERDAAL